MDFYYDGATMAKYGIDGANFIEVRFSNVDQYSETWYTVGIAPTSKVTPASVPTQKRRKMKLLLFQWFIFLMFRNLIGVSYNDGLSQGALLYACISIIICDQPEEMSLLCLKLLYGLQFVHSAVTCHDLKPAVTRT